MSKVYAYASPNIALIKYWGKTHKGFYPATSSLGITLRDWQTQTSLFSTDQDYFLLNGQEDNLSPFLDKLRSKWKISKHFHVESINNFPTAAGLASSASGFAALAEALYRYRKEQYTEQEVSSLAREGSVSAARSVIGGFVALQREKDYAKQIMDSESWSSLRVVVVVVEAQKKLVSSRQAMKLCQDTSPVWSVWVEKAELWYKEAVSALLNRDLAKLGYFMSLSYRTMFSTMLTCNPILIYWQADSLNLIKSCEVWRKEGINCWETMDAGPQVKILCEERDLSTLCQRLETSYGYLSYHIDCIGKGTRQRGCLT